MRRATLGALLAVALLTGCDVMGSAKKSPPPRALSEGRFVYLANHACALQTRRLRKLVKPTSPATAVRYLRRAIAIYERTVVAFRSLTPPRTDRAAYNRLLRLLDGEDMTFYRALRAAESGQVAGRKPLLRRMHRLGRQMDSESAKLGLRVCARP